MTILLALASAVLIGPDAPLPAFEDFPAVLTLETRAEDIWVVPGSNAARYPARLREELLLEPNFAGRFRVVTPGCGTMCQVVIILDLETGRAFDLEAQSTAAMGTVSQVDSQLLLINNPEDAMDSPWSVYVFALKFDPSTGTFELIWTTDPAGRLGYSDD
jgi:hypothetical protein